MRYRDTWKKRIPIEKLKAYKQLLDEGFLKDPNVLYDMKTGITTVEYSSDLQHAQILEMLKARAMEV